MSRLITLLNRELQEYQRSLLWAPLLMAAGLALLMLVSGLVTNRLGMMDNSLLQALVEESGQDSRVSIRVENLDDGEQAIEYRVERSEDDKPLDGSATEASAAQNVFLRVETFNPALNTIHRMMLSALLLLSANYLLGTLFNDRRDRSVLFWKSMPVSEWENVRCKLAIVLLVAPAVFIAASLLVQVAGLLVAMMVAWRLELDPFAAVLAKVEIGQLLVFQLVSWPLLAVQLAPVYAWLLCASAFAQRSPFMTAVIPVAALVLVETILLGSRHFSSAVTSHIPHLSGNGNTLADYHLPGVPGLFLGLVIAASLLWLAVYLRRFRFEP